MAHNAADTARCVRCKKDPPDEGYKTCSRCRTQRRDTRRARYETFTPEKRQALATQTKTWQKNNPEKNKGIQRTWEQRVRKIVVDHYGGKCACCGETEFAFLTLHHIDGDGAAHRKALGLNRNVAGWAFAWRLLKAGLPDAHLEVLCWNCHMATEHRGICPHKEGNDNA